LFILFIFCECLLVVHLLASLVNSIHRNLLCQVAKLLSVVQHTVSVVTGVVAAVVGPVRVVTIVGPVRVVGLVVALVRVVGLVVALVRVVAAVVGLVVALVRVVTPGSHAILITGIFEGLVQRRRSVEIIISLVGVCLIIHLV